MYLDPGEHPCDRMTLFPGSPGFLITTQLMPPTCEDEPDRGTDVTGMKVAFSNYQEQTHRDARIKMSFGNFLVKNLTCSNRIEIIAGPSGNRWSGVVDMMARELLPGEHKSCEIQFAASVKTPSVKFWKNHFSSNSGWSRSAWSDSLNRPASVSHKIWSAS